MKLLIDIGNTRLKWAWADGVMVSRHGYVFTSDIASTIPSELKNSLPSKKKFEVWISSVASKEVLDKVAEAWFQLDDEVSVNVVKVTAQVNGITNGYADLERLGVDRWVALAGARYLQPSGHLIVVDAGTAVTIDWLDADNKFQGGAILPGPGLMHDSLVGSTAGIKSEFRNTRQIIGKDTAECVNSGVSYGLVGAIENVVNEMMKVVNQPAKTLLTGGASKELASQLSIPNKQHHDLVLTGLLAISVRGSGER